MMNQFAISGEIQISAQSSGRSSDTDSIQRRHVAAAVVDLLPHLGLDCYLVAPDRKCSRRAHKRDADDPASQKPTN